MGTSSDHLRNGGILMKNLKMLLGLLFLLMISSCASVEVTHEYNSEVDFTTFKTFNWLPAHAEANLAQVSVKRMRDAVNTKLQAKGYRLDTVNPDFYIALYGGSEHKIDVTTFWAGYMEDEEEQIRQYEEGLLILDIADSKSKQRIWRGEARGEFSPAWPQGKQEKIIDEATDKLLKEFPPVSER
jgi:hypothetical protein